MIYYNTLYTGSPILGTTPEAGYGCTTCPGFGAERTIEEAEFTRGREEQEVPTVPPQAKPQKAHWGVWAAFGLLGLGVVGGIYLITR